MTNLTEHSGYLSRREDFGDNGYPRVWKKSYFKEGVLTKELVVGFKRIDPEAKFDETEVFLPDFLQYYAVSDVTSGTAVPAKDLFKASSPGEAP